MTRIYPTFMQSGYRCGAILDSDGYQGQIDGQLIELNAKSRKLAEAMIRLRAIEYSRKDKDGRSNSNRRRTSRGTRSVAADARTSKEGRHIWVDRRWSQ